MLTFVYNMWHTGCTSDLIASPVKVNSFPQNRQSRKHQFRRKKTKICFQICFLTCSTIMKKLLSLYCLLVMPECQLSVSICVWSKTSISAGSAQGTWYWLHPLTGGWEEQVITFYMKICIGPFTVSGYAWGIVCFWQISWGKGWGKKVSTVPYTCVQCLDCSSLSLFTPSSTRVSKI